MTIHLKLCGNKMKYKVLCSFFVPTENLKLIKRFLGRTLKLKEEMWKYEMSKNVKGIRHLCSVHIPGPIKIFLQAVCLEFVVFLKFESYLLPFDRQN